MVQKEGIDKPIEEKRSQETTSINIKYNKGDISNQERKGELFN